MYLGSGHPLHFAAAFAALITLSACDGDIGLDRFIGPAGENAPYIPPSPDKNGIITYDTYQVAVALPGDTVRAMADRFGQSVNQMSSLNGINPDTPLRSGEVVVLPTGIDGQIIDTPIRRPGEVDIETIASDAIEAADPVAEAAPKEIERSDREPTRHRVQQGETALSIARIYDVSVRAIADWNGLGPNNRVRVGQSLLIPPPNSIVTPVLRPAEPARTVSKPGQESEVSEPPSSTNPDPVDEPVVTATEPEQPVNDTVETGGTLTLPVNGPILRDFEKGKSDGIDIAAAAGSTVVAAGNGTVAAITQDAAGVPILVIRHADGLLTVYAGIDQILVARGDAVQRGQKIAVVRDSSPSFLHFETRRGFESVDPATFLN